jgi:hypothetical protein
MSTGDRLTNQGWVAILSFLLVLGLWALDGYSHRHPDVPHGIFALLSILAGLILLLACRFAIRGDPGLNSPIGTGLRAAVWNLWAIAAVLAVAGVVMVICRMSSWVLIMGVLMAGMAAVSHIAIRLVLGKRDGR